MLSQYGNDGRFKLTALWFVNGDGVGKVRIGDVIPLIKDLPSIRIEWNRTRQFLIIYFPNDPDIPIEHPEIVIQDNINDNWPMLDKFIWQYSHLRLGKPNSRSI